MAKWYFKACDNGGKKQVFVVVAASKIDAIRKGMDRARKNAAGDIITWDCKLKQA